MHLAVYREKRKPRLLKALTGIMRVSRENLFSGLNNPMVNTVLDEKYSEYFGFTEDEVRKMAAYYHRPDAMDEIRFWYDGYRFGNKEIYNPYRMAGRYPVRQDRCPQDNLFHYPILQGPCNNKPFSHLR